MSFFYEYTLKILRGAYGKIFAVVSKGPDCEQNPEKASKIIYDLLIKDEPCMIARFGSTELSCLNNYLGIHKDKKNVVQFVKGEVSPWWWDDKIIKQMQNWSGFFPAETILIERFCKMMISDIPEVDILGSWLNEEVKVDYLHSAKKVHLRLLEPFWYSKPWTAALKGKKILVIHPFATSILNQYNKRLSLFENNDTLPQFKSLTVIKAVQSLGEGDKRFNDWFEALEYMKSEIDKVDYDVCLVGCGAYGFHLAAHIKRSGKKGIHMGGALQLLFGIKGKRWEDPNYGVKEWGIPHGSYSDLMNEYWVRPDVKDKPKNAQKVEGACYW